MSQVFYERDLVFYRVLVMCGRQNLLATHLESLGFEAPSYVKSKNFHPNLIAEKIAGTTTRSILAFNFDQFKNLSKRVLLLGTTFDDVKQNPQMLELADSYWLFLEDDMEVDGPLLSIPWLGAHLRKSVFVSGLKPNLEPTNLGSRALRHWLKSRFPKLRIAAAEPQGAQSKVLEQGLSCMLSFS